MLPSQIMILMAIAISSTGADTLIRQMDIAGEYIGYLCDSLVKRGYMEKASGRYQLTAMGNEAISDFLRKNSIVKEDLIKRLQLLGIDIRQKQEQAIDKLQEEAVKVMY